MEGTRKEMSEDKKKCSPLMEILREAFPGRRDDQIAPIGLIYAGITWGKDHRYGKVPNDKDGNPIDISSDKAYQFYLSWLADYLYGLETEPSEEQLGLCKYVENMEPEDGVLLIGMNAGLYQSDVERIEPWIEDNEPFSAYLKDLRQYDCGNNERFDEKAERMLYERVRKEMEDHAKYCPGILHADVAYRVPLSNVLRKVDEKREREKLLDKFYLAFDEYFRK